MPSCFIDAFIRVVFRDSLMKPISIFDSFAAGGRAVVLGLALSAVAAFVPGAAAQTASVRQSPALREVAPQKA